MLRWIGDSHDNIHAHRRRGKSHIPFHADLAQIEILLLRVILVGEVALTYSRPGRVTFRIERSFNSTDSNVLIGKPGKQYIFSAQCHFTEGQTFIDDASDHD